MTIAGSRPSRRCGRASRISRIVLCSVPAIARSQASSSIVVERAAGRTAGVDDEPVQPAELLDRASHGLRRPIRRSEIDRERQDAGRRRPAARHARHPGAFGDERAGHRGTESAARAAHQEAPVRQPEVHGSAHLARDGFVDPEVRGPAQVLAHRQARRLRIPGPDGLEDAPVPSLRVDRAVRPALEADDPPEPEDRSDHVDQAREQVIPGRAEQRVVEGDVAHR